MGQLTNAQTNSQHSGRRSRAAHLGKDFLSWLGGFSPRTVRELPQHYRLRCIGFGIAILISASLAFFGGLHTALHYGANPAAAVAFSFFWASLIAAVEHVIVVYLNRKSGFWVLPLRILMSLALSFLVSTPLILFMCKGAIQKTFEDTASAEIERAKAARETAVKKIQQGVVAQRDSTRVREDKKNAEVAGASGKQGRGDIYDDLHQSYINDSVELRVIKESAEENLAAENRSLQQDTVRIRQRQEKYSKEELLQLEALFGLLHRPAVLFRWLTLVLALMLIETLPLLLKISSRQDLYEEVVAAQADRVRNRLAVQRAMDDFASRQAQEKRDLAGTIDRLAREGNAIATMATSVDESKASLMKAGNSPSINTGLKYLDVLLEKRINEVINGGATEAPVPEQGALFNVDTRYDVLVSTDIDLDHPFRANRQMLAKAAAVCAGASSELDKARRIYDYLLEAIPYDENFQNYPGGYRTAMDTWNDRTGCCGQLAVLFVVFARAQGLHAAYAHVCRDHNDLEQNHACAELILTDGSIYLVDIAYRSFNTQHKSAMTLPDAEVARQFKSWRKVSA